MSFFADLYKGRNRFMAQDFNVAERPLGLKFVGTKKWPCGAKKELWLEVDWTQKDKEVTGSKHKVTWKTNSNEVTSKLEIDPKKGKFESTIMPESWSTDDTKLGLRFLGTSDHANKAFTWMTMFRVGLPNLTDKFGLFSSFGLKCCGGKTLQEFTTMAHFNKKTKVGVHLEGSVKDKSISSTQVRVCQRFSDDLKFFSQYWHEMKKLELGLVTIGDKAPFMDRAIWKCYLEFDENKKIKSKAFEMAGEIKLDDSNTMKIKNKICCGKWVCTGGIIHKVSDSLSIRAFDTIAPLDVWKNRNIDSYNFGVNFDFSF